MYPFTNTNNDGSDGIDDSVACSNCYGGTAYPAPAATCAWCGAPRGVCGCCGAAPTEFPLCAECGLQEESVDALARRIHGAGEDGVHRLPPGRAWLRLSPAASQSTSLEMTRSAVLRRVIQFGIDALERELGLAKPEKIPAELHARVAAVAARSPDMLQLVARRARQLAPVVEASPARVLGTTRLAPPTAVEPEVRDRAALDRGLRVLEQELGITP